MPPRKGTTSNPTHYWKKANDAKLCELIKSGAIKPDYFCPAAFSRLHKEWPWKNVKSFKTLIHGKLEKFSAEQAINSAQKVKARNKGESG
jgi:hypothetical protein